VSTDEDVEVVSTSVVGRRQGARFDAAHRKDFDNSACLTLRSPALPDYVRPHRGVGSRGSRTASRALAKQCWLPGRGARSVAPTPRLRWRIAEHATRGLAHESPGWRPTTSSVTVHRWRRTGCSARMAPGHHASRAAGEDLPTVRVDEPVRRHTRRGDMYVAAVVDLTPSATGPTRPLDMAEPPSSAVGGDQASCARERAASWGSAKPWTWDGTRDGVRGYHAPPPPPRRGPPCGSLPGA
jgi:hypothetical protein